MKLKTSRFYGWSLEYIEELDHSVFRQAWLGITMIEAQDFLIQLKVIDYPNANEKDRKKIHKEITKKAYFQDKERAVKVNDLNNMYGMSDISKVVEANKLKKKKKGK